MKRLLASVTALALVLGAGGLAQAGHRPGGGGPSVRPGGAPPGGMRPGGVSPGFRPGIRPGGAPQPGARTYHQTHGVRFSQGWYYKGRNHHHWSHHRRDERYGCDLYYCPSACCWYYWCPPDNCYYPVSYCPYGTCSFPDSPDDPPEPPAP